MKAKVLVLAMACWISACNGQVAMEGNRSEGDALPANTEQAEVASSLFRPGFAVCLDSAGGVTPDIQACIEDEFVFQDAQLQASYNELQNSLSDKEKSLLEASQKGWMTERETECVWEAETEGQAQRLEANLCHLRKTAERVKVLEGRMK